VESAVTALGKLKPRETVDVGAQVSGQLQKLHVAIGDRVEKGDLLAEIDARVMKTRVDASRAQVRELEAGLAQQRAERALARLQAERNRRLLTADAIARQDVETSDVALQVADARIAQTAAQIERIASTLEGEEANLSFTQIFAPISGTVVSLAALEGQTLNANQSAPTILTIADLLVMTVEADVSEADVMRLRPGLQAYFSTLGQTGKRWTSTLRQVLPQPEILNDVVLYKALLDVDNADGALLPEMSAQVFFVLAMAENVVTVPLAALRQHAARDPAAGNSPGLGAMPAVAATDDADPARRETAFAALREAAAARPDAVRSVVLVLDEAGQPRPRPVLVGLRTRVEAEIVAGLEPGDRVVIGETGGARGGGGGLSGIARGFGQGTRN
jgi:macrolide-specific efflux system membrane fusion protein